jgi:hypothetical protein
LTRLKLSWAAGLFLVGALGGLIGDAAHVETGTTAYLSHGVPFIWRSALWFPIAVGLGTVATAELRLRIGVAEGWSGPDRLREAVAAVAAVLAVYAVTAIVHDEAEGAATTLVIMLAVLVATRFASGPAALACGLAAAVVGTTVEVVLVKANVAAYAPTCDGLFGVALWLPALYFTFGVVVSRLVELMVSADTH